MQNVQYSTYNQAQDSAHRKWASLTFRSSPFSADRELKYWSSRRKKRDALFIQFIEHKGPLHVWSITCSSSGAATQTALGILRAYNVSWPSDIIRTQYTKCRFLSISWGWASNAPNMYRLFILNKLNEKCITLVSLCWYTVMHGQQNIKFDIFESSETSCISNMQEGVCHDFRESSCALLSGSTRLLLQWAGG
jgi:hypothetical protein